jgi:23S rRNA (adenine-N6)-dimethyltransferase
MPSPRRPRTARLRPSSPGVHHLSCPPVIERLVRGAGLGPGDLVIDFGAGPGTLTAPLARTGARVLAIERDEVFVATLRRRFADQPLVRVVPGDLRRLPLPRTDFTVVANIPFAVSTALLRRLLTPVPVRLDRAELVCEWGLARRLTAGRLRDLETAWWAARYELRLVRRIPARCFSPPPAVDAAHLRVRRRPDVDVATQAMLWPLLGAVHRQPDRPARQVLGDLVAHRRAGHLLRERGTDPATPAGEVPVGRWTGVAAALAATRSLTPPPLPRALRR